MSLALSLCLVLPNICDVPELDDYLEALSLTETAGAVERVLWFLSTSPLNRSRPPCASSTTSPKEDPGLTIRHRLLEGCFRFSGPCGRRTTESQEPSCTTP